MAKMKGRYWDETKLNNRMKEAYNHRDSLAALSVCIVAVRDGYKLVKVGADGKIRDTTKQ